MFYLICGLLLSLGGVAKDFFEKRGENLSANPPKRNVFLYIGMTCNPDSRILRNIYMAGTNYFQ